MDGYCVRHLKQKCAICMEKVPSTNSANSKRLNCGHAYHLKCIIQWYETSESCPICRQIQHDDILLKFKNKVQNALRKKYMTAIRSLEDEIREMRNNS